MERVATDEAFRSRLIAGGRAAQDAEFGEARVVALYRAFFTKVAR